MRMPTLPHLRGLLLSLVVGAVGLTGCDARDPVSRGQIKAFDTTFDLSLIGVNRKHAVEVTSTLEQDLRLMAQEWHAWSPEGPVSRINMLFNSDSEPFAASPSVLPILKLSKDLARRSDHLFNPAIGHLSRAWGFQGEPKECRHPPDDKLIDLVKKKNPTLNSVEVDGFRVWSDNNSVKLDFRAIQKGFAIDLAAARLQELGVNNASIRVDGNILAIGSRAGNPWTVGVRGPAGGGIIATLEIADGEAVFTTGEYQNNFTWKGKLYHDVIDPRTGHPASGTASVTILHSNASTADAAATALFIAGPDDWYRIARQMGLQYVMLTDASGRIHMNPAMQGRVKLQRNNLDIVISEPLS